MLSYEKLKTKLLDIDLCVDNEFLSKYCKLITEQYDNSETTGCQKHHIVPKFFFKQFNIPVDNSADNVVKLKYKYHVLAHYYLAKCATHKYQQFANCNAINYLKNSNRLDDDVILDEIQDLYDFFIKELTKRSHTPAVNKKIQQKLTGRSSPMLGKHYGNCGIKKSRQNPNPKNTKLSYLAHQRTGERNSFYGKTHSETTKQLIAEKNGFPVEMLDYNTKEVLMDFVSAAAAGKYLIEIGLTTNTGANHRILDTCKSNNLDRLAYGYS